MLANSISAELTMEQILFFFLLGVALASLVISFNKNLTTLILFTSIPITLVFFWFLWATNGAHFMLSNIRESGIANELHFAKKADYNKTSEEATESPADYLAALGQAGDLYGGINALFAALAFAGVAMAAIMQARSLQLAREQQIQQSFEPLFFHLLSLHDNVSAPKFKLRSNLTRNSKPIMAPDGTEQVVSFSRAMAVMRRVLRMKTVSIRKSPANSEELKKECSELYSTFYSFNQEQLGPHFRTLFQIFKLIDTSNFDSSSKIKYANIARSTLGSDQIFLLAINSLSPAGEDFRPFIEKYGLLKHIARGENTITLDEQIATFCYHKNATLGTRDRIPKLVS